MRVQVLANTLSWAFAAVAAAALVLVILQSAGVIGDAAPLWAAFGTAATASVVIAVASAVRRTPTRLEVAQVADRHLDSYECISTYVELAECPGLQRPSFASALKRSAHKHAQKAVPTRVVPIRVPRAFGVAIILASSAAAIQTVPEEWLGTSSQPMEAVATGPDLVGDPALAEKVNRLADLVSEEASRTNDPYLTAVGRALETLSEDMRRTQDQTAGLEELQGLLVQLEAASEGDLDIGLVEEFRHGPGEQVDASVTESVDHARSGRDDDRNNTNAWNEEPAEGGDSASARSPAGDESPQRDSLDELLERFEAARQDSEEGAPPRAPEALGNPESMADDGTSSPEMQARFDLEREIAKSLAPDNAFAGEVVGASSSADRGASSRAGDGSQPLGGQGTTSTESWQAATQTVDVHLPSTEDASGRRIRVERAPEAQISEVDVGSLQAGSWSSPPEAIVMRERFDRTVRAAVADYFTPDRVDR